MALHCFKEMLKIFDTLIRNMKRDYTLKKEIYYELYRVKVMNKKPPQLDLSSWSLDRWNYNFTNKRVFDEIYKRVFDEIYKRVFDEIYKLVNFTRQAPSGMGA